MSTKATLYYDGKIAVSEEMIDNSIVISLDDVRYWVDATPTHLTLTIPLRVWATIRGHTSRYERYLTMSDDDIRREAEDWVRSRIAGHDPAEPFSAITGVGIAGDVRAPFDEQVESYVEFYRQIRDEDVSGPVPRG